MRVVKTTDEWTGVWRGMARTRRTTDANQADVVADGGDMGTHSAWVESTFQHAGAFYGRSWLRCGVRLCFTGEQRPRQPLPSVLYRRAHLVSLCSPLTHIPARRHLCCLGASLLACSLMPLSTLKDVDTAIITRRAAAGGAHPLRHLSPPPVASVRTSPSMGRRARVKDSRDNVTRS